jgi:hypothetical protein
MHNLLLLSILSGLDLLLKSTKGGEAIKEIKRGEEFGYKKSEFHFFVL